MEKGLPSIQWRLGEDAQKKIALTFDDGPHPDSTPLLLDILSAYEVNASFFLLGANAIKYPELVDRIKNEGHHICNHGYNHMNGWQTGHSEYVDNALKGCHILGHEFRPPYGKITPHQYQCLASDYQQKLTFWSLMPGDFDPKVTPQILEKRLFTRTQERDIVVLHDTPIVINKLQQVLPKYLHRLINQGITVSSLRSLSEFATR